MAKTKKSAIPDADELARFIVANVPASQLLEMYYWCQEPSLLRILRGLAAVPPETQDELACFLEGLQGQDIKIQRSRGDNDFTLYRDVVPPLKH